MARFSEETWYRVVCDRCGELSLFAEVSEELALESAFNSGGWDRADDGRVLCGVCLDMEGA